ncbi:MAG: c-type cytochrome [Candidatus Lambdaproteobacteria bacterium]|nr:c-type cytochrome [Candidatus Lambdaproteobacteria bacterium]
MKRALAHPLTLSVLAALFLYGVFAYGIRPPVPRSLLIVFMIVCVVGILLAGTFRDETASRLAAPLRALLGDPRLKALRLLVLLALVVLAFGLTAAGMRPDRSAPVELRSVHPAPPDRVRVHGKSYDLKSLRNPLREQAPKGSERYASLVGQGRELYHRNCIYCHGDLLDGKGHFAGGLNPRPANFQDVGTIAQLQESYLFWRIATGGPGLPQEGAPWASSMPAWHEMLREEEVWKVIMFLYDYTGHEPRSWELDPRRPGEPVEAPPAAPAARSAQAGPLALEAARALYLRQCAHCHGEKGDGQGISAGFMHPRPRDFTFGTFKFRTTPAPVQTPSRADLRRSIGRGLPGTAMPGWEQALSAEEIDGLIQLIRTFGGWEQERWPTQTVAGGDRVPASRESIARGAESFAKICAECHGAQGRGDSTSGKKLKDDWGERIFARNLTRPETWRWVRDAGDLFALVSVGIPGTPMPEHASKLSVAERWDIVNFAMTLRERAPPFDAGRTVVQGIRIEGALPGDPAAPAWEQAPPVVFSLIPNVIREPRLYHSLNTAVSARVLYNDKAIAIRLDVDDPTYSVPGDPKEQALALDEVVPASDAVAVQFPAATQAAGGPLFRHGDPGHPVNLWYWGAPRAAPAASAQVRVMDAQGLDRPPLPRAGPAGLTATGSWHDGQWRIVMTRALRTDDSRDVQFEIGRYTPVAFANWDGWAGQRRGRHTLTGWYWLVLMPAERPVLIYGSAALGGLAAGLVFIGLARSQRCRFGRPDRAE